MNPETQILVERIEALERRGRGANLTALLAIVVALAALALPLLKPSGPKPVAPDRIRYSVIEANRFLLRDAEGRVAGGLEVDQNGTAKLVLGRGTGEGAVFVEAQKNGIAHLTLRGANGGLRAAMVGGETPSIVLSTQDKFSGVSLTTRPDGAGTIAVADARGRPRFRAP
jgi:hypothetical protein